MNQTRKWTEYLPLPEDQVTEAIPLNASFSHQASLMGGYGLTKEAYSSRESFFNTYVHGRYAVWDTYIRKWISKDDTALFLGSGRGINEMLLHVDGYNITCSDQEVPSCIEATNQLFGKIRYMPLDILATPSKQTYDVVVSLSMAYLFDQDALDTFFANAADSLAPGGRLILDSAGSAPNAVCTFFHERFLPLDARLHCLRLNLAPRSKIRYRVQARHKGFRRTDHAFIRQAEAQGFRLVQRRDFDPCTDLNRSWLLSGIMRNTGSPLARFLARTLGKKMRHIRMFIFDKA